ncbi:unnamed protein product, partial [Citrullus colocynthis]
MPLFLRHLHSRRLAPSSLSSPLSLIQPSHHRQAFYSRCRSCSPHCLSPLFNRRHRRNHEFW